jgi:hypothetical protein
LGTILIDIVTCGDYFREAFDPKETEMNVFKNQRPKDMKMTLKQWWPGLSDEVCELLSNVFVPEKRRISVSDFLSWVKDIKNFGDSKNLRVKRDLTHPPAANMSDIGLARAPATYVLDHQCNCHTGNNSVCLLSMRGDGSMFGNSSFNGVEKWLSSG